jgi:hypothetical protein
MRGQADEGRGSVLLTRESATSGMSIYDRSRRGRDEATCMCRADTHPNLRPSSLDGRCRITFEMSLAANPLGRGEEVIFDGS